MTFDVSVRDFLLAAGWGDATLTPLPADWSTRRFGRLNKSNPLPLGERIESPALSEAKRLDFLGEGYAYSSYPPPSLPLKGGGVLGCVTQHSTTAFLMQDNAETVRTFVRISAILRNTGLSAPAVYAQDETKGWLLLEDFGDRNVGRLIDAGDNPAPYRHQAVDVLLTLRQKIDPATLQDLPIYDTAKFISLLTPFVADMAPAATQEFETLWTSLLQPLEHLPRTLMLRDFMADNLMHLPTRSGVQSLGLVDFDLAGNGDIAYDLMSLTEQVRRDYPEQLRQDLFDYYRRGAPDMDAETLRQAMAILSVQRHLRIIALLKKRPAKQAMQQRAQTHVRRYLSTPVFTPLRDWFRAHAPMFLEDA